MCYLPKNFSERFCNRAVFSKFNSLNSEKIGKKFPSRFYPCFYTRGFYEQLRLLDRRLTIFLILSAVHQNRCRSDGCHCPVQTAPDQSNEDRLKDPPSSHVPTSFKRVPDEEHANGREADCREDEAYADPQINTPVIDSTNSAYVAQHTKGNRDQNREHCKEHIFFSCRALYTLYHILSSPK